MLSLSDLSNRKGFRSFDMIFLLVAAGLLFLLAGCGLLRRANTAPSETSTIEFEILNTFPHDPDAYTQGLLFNNGYLYESTGLKGRSSLRKVSLETGEVIQQKQIDSQYFAEGLAVYKGRLIQLTLDAGIAYVYDPETFEVRRTFRYSGAGWGLTKCGDRLVMSDGSSELRFLDPESFVETGRLKVTESGEPVDNLNELEVIGNKIYANILHTYHIAVINSETGEVERRIDLERLRKIASADGQSINVLNGIAYDRETGRLFVTGKLWPKLFEIRILE